MRQLGSVHETHLPALKAYLKGQLIHEEVAEQLMSGWQAVPERIKPV
jgi:hypothetical protein